MKEKPNVNFNLSIQTYHRDKHKFSEPACTASYFGLFQTDLAIKFWFNLLRGETKIQEQVPSGSQGEPAFPEELKWTSLSWHIPALHSPQQSPSEVTASPEHPCVWCKPSPSFVPQGWGTACHWNMGSASSLWNTSEKYHQVWLTHCWLPKQQLLSYPYRILPCISQVLC